MVRLYTQMRFCSAVTACSSARTSDESGGGPASGSGPAQALRAVNNGSVVTDATSNWRLRSIGFKDATELRLLRLSAGSPSVSAGRTVLLRSPDRLDLRR